MMASCTCAPISDIARAREALAAATSSTDPEIVALYVAAARSVTTRMRHELDALDSVLAARERELARVAGGRSEQLALEAARASRDVAQLDPTETGR